MPLESAPYLNSLDATNPASTDPKSQGDDHLRLIKSSLKATFPNVAGAVTASHDELNFLDGVTGSIQEQLDGKGTVTLAGVQTLANKTLTAPALGNTPMTGVKTINFNGEFDNGNSGTAKTVTLAAGQKQKIALTGNATLTINFTGAAVGTYQLRLIQDATGGRTLAWSGLSGARWLGAASAPAINAASAGETIVNIFFDGAACVQSLVKVGAV